MKHEYYEIVNLKKIKPVNRKYKGGNVCIIVMQTFEMIFIKFMVVERVLLKAPALKCLLFDTNCFLCFQIHAGNQEKLFLNLANKKRSIGLNSQ